MRPSETVAAHSAELRSLLRDNGICSALIFGSAVITKDTLSSDLDLAVKFALKPLGFEYYGALANLEQLVEEITGVHVDVIDVEDPDAPRILGHTTRKLL